MKNNFCDLPQEEINKLPNRFKGFLLSPFHLNKHNGYVMVPDDCFKEMIDIIAEYALTHNVKLTGGLTAESETDGRI
jgi:CTP-dependent riboflavin kinase